MRLTLVSIGIVASAVACFAAGVAAGQVARSGARSGDRADERQPKRLLMHYMPWYHTPEDSGIRGMHLTGEENLIECLVSYY